MLLKGKVAIITGAASIRGIGKAVARTFAAHGARVAILDLDATAAAAAAADIGPGHLGLACDVTSKSACEHAASIAGQAKVLGPDVSRSRRSRVGVEIKNGDASAVRGESSCHCFADAANRRCAGDDCNLALE